MARGRPAKHPDLAIARRLANQRAQERARSRGLVQRSLTLPVDCWELIRAARVPGETSDAQTVARLLLTLGAGADRSSADG